MTLLLDQRKWRGVLGAALVAAGLGAIPAIAAVDRDGPIARPAERTEPGSCNPEIGPPPEDVSKACPLPKGDAPEESKKTLALRLWILKSLSISPIWFFR
jgi:hypothetical protein